MNALTPHSADADGKPSTSVRIFTPLLAVGVYIILVGVVFWSPFALNSTAIQNDMYMTNLFLAPAIIALGVICLLVGWIGMQRAVNAGRAREIWRRPVIIAALGAAVMIVGYLAFGGHYVFASGEIQWPPYMNGASMVIALVIGILVLVAASIWGFGARRRV